MRLRNRNARELPRRVRPPNTAASAASGLLDWLALPVPVFGRAGAATTTGFCAAGAATGGFWAAGATGA
ncbi:MAG TPA: hypothetical protein VFD32_06195 [Dehalococcoidia bacterium]|nr:hypothetical protein [Dehalococcoidia bacterium]